MAKQKKETDKKESKRVKISFQKLEDIKFKPVDMNKVFEEDNKRVESDKVRYQKDLKQEKERFENLPCPSCKNTSKDRNIIRSSNGPVIYGGRNSSTVYADYLICKNCGTMYVDLHKKEITPPYEGLFSSNRGGKFRC